MLAGCGVGAIFVALLYVALLQCMAGGLVWGAITVVICGGAALAYFMTITGLDPYDYRCPIRALCVKEDYYMPLVVVCFFLNIIHTRTLSLCACVVVLCAHHQRQDGQSGWFHQCNDPDLHRLYGRWNRLLVLLCRRLSSAAYQYCYPGGQRGRVGCRRNAGHAGAHPVTQ